MATQYWLLKTEPSTFSIQDLKKAGTTPWNGVRNFQARNFMLTMKPGDACLIYHSGDDKSVVGIATVTSEPYPDLDPKKKGEFVQVDLKFSKVLPKPVTLAALKSQTKFKGLLLLKQSRLSVMPVTKTEFKAIQKV